MPSIRGATTCKENNYDEIIDRTGELLTEIIHVNCLDISDIDSILFTATADLTKAYPAVAARRLGITAAALMCTQEMFVENSLRKCIRVQVTVNNGKKQNDMRFVYLHEAKSLRPDLVSESMPSVFAVAIDGPSGSGKSTAARAVAGELGFVYVDTGAMYRAAALHCIKNNIDCTSVPDVEAMTDTMDISIIFGQNGQRVILNGDDVTELLRTQQVADGSSKVASIKKVREKLVAIQKDIALKNNVVMDGRDIATNVIPWAQVKLYMDASADERSSRRLLELYKLGIKAEFEKIKAEINERDYRDMNRDESPLTRCEGSILLNTDGMNAEQVKDAILTIVKDIMTGEKQ